ncbi:MAG: MFS transporter [Candidatus Zixiibacteriota bacterium]
MEKEKVRLYALTRFSVSFALGTILPAYVLYFRHYRITLFQIGLLAAVFEASILLFEIPTGLVADVFGRRMSVILSAVVSFISGLVFILFPFLGAFIVAEIVGGLGETLRSGALEAWLVDTLKHEGQEDSIKHAFAQGTKFKTVGNLCGLILGGYLATLDIRLVWVPTAIVFFVLGMFLLLKMREEYRPEKETSERIVPKLSDTTTRSLRVIKSQRLILALVLLALFSEFSFETISQYWQVHFSESLLINTRYFGWILAVASVLTILFIGRVTRFFEKLRDGVHSLTILTVLFLLSLLFIAVTRSPLLAVAFFIFLQILVNFKEPIFLDLFNRHIPSEQRATLLSFQSLVGSGGEVSAGLCIGVVAENFGLRTTFGLGTAVLFLGIVVFLLLATARPTRCGAQKLKAG